MADPYAYYREDVYGFDSQATLLSNERQWRDRQKFLETRGYMLRPRYHPNWTPSWKYNDKSWLGCEDSISLLKQPSVIDARRIADNKLVYIKRVPTHSSELEITSMLSSTPYKSNPRNHCVEVLEVFQDDDDKEFSFMVMPFLRSIRKPEFDFVDNIVDFVDQMLEGLVFLHEAGIAHRDCEASNIGMDIDSLFPSGYHPVYTDETPDLKRNYYGIRRGFTPARYFFIDFGISSHIREGQPKLVLGEDGRDQDVPELSSTCPYDPFKVDIFILGNMFRKQLDLRYSNVGFLRPLIEAMTAADPASRPPAQEAMRQWRRLRRWVSPMHRSWRVQPREETHGEAAFLNVLAFFRSAAYYPYRAKHFASTLRPALQLAHQHSLSSTSNDHSEGSGDSHRIT